MDLYPVMLRGSGIREQKRPVWLLSASTKEEAVEDFEKLTFEEIHPEVTVGSLHDLANRLLIGDYTERCVDPHLCLLAAGEPDVTPWKTREVLATRKIGIVLEQRFVLEQE